MKNIIIGILFCLPLFSEAQIFQDTGYKSKGLWATSIMKPPTDTLIHKQGIALKNGVLYIGNGTAWAVVSGGTSGITDSSFFKSVYGKRTQSGRFVFNKTALDFDSLQSFKITDSTRSASNKLYGHETKFIKGFEEAAYDSNYISRIKVNAATGVELSFSDQNNSDTNNIVKVDANGFTINIPSKGAGKVLQSDVNGNATWTTPAGGGGTTYTSGYGLNLTGTVFKADSTVLTSIPRLTNTLANYVDLTTAQTIGGAKTFASDLIVNGNFFGTRGVATNLWVGPSAGLSSTATSSVGIGNYALSLSSGASSTGVGSGALYNSTSISAVAVGESAGINTSGGRITTVGANSAQGSTGADLTALGNSAAINNAAAQITALGIAAAIGNTQPNGIHIGTGLMITVANAPNQIIFAPGALQQRHSIGNYTANRDIAWKNASGTVAFLSDVSDSAQFRILGADTIESKSSKVKLGNLRISGVGTTTIDQSIGALQLKAFTNINLNALNGQATIATNNLNRLVIAADGNAEFYKNLRVDTLKSVDVQTGSIDASLITTNDITANRLLITGADVYTAGASYGLSKTNTLFNPSTTIGTLTVDFPSAPKDGTIVKLNFGGTIAVGSPVITAFGLSNGTLYGTYPSTLVGGDRLSFIYYSATGKWHREN